MHWFQALDVALLRLVNQTLSNPVFDVIMPLVSRSRSLFIPVAVVTAWTLWKGGARGRLCLLMVGLIVGAGDGLICNTVKSAVARPRPYVTLPDVRLPANKTGTGTVEAMGTLSGESSRVPGRSAYSSFPSSHAANCFAAAMIVFVYYRRSWRFLVPLACLVSFSRVYLGVHYPSDVLAGAILGAGCAVAGLLAIDFLWRWIGGKWFPLWWQALPSILNVEGKRQTAEEEGRDSRLEGHWLRLGHVLIGVLLLAHLAYLWSGMIELTEDEAYQWIWSKHLALSYYSKPPLIAYTQFLSTQLWGDNAFGVRFFSPVIGAVLGFLLLRFLAREVNARAGVVLLLILMATPLLAAGAVLMTVDPLSVLFWTAAMLAGWRAVQSEGTTRDWLWTGLWMGLGFLSKYTALFQWLCWGVFFLLWPPARAQLRRIGPYLALLINLICTLPVLIWNHQHHWVTVRHLADRAGLHEERGFTLRHFLEFTVSEIALLNPVFLAATLWAAVAFWRSRRNDARMVYCFSMGAPLFLSYWLYSVYAKVLPNWIAPSVLPLFCLMVLYWEQRWRAGVRAVRAWLIAGLGFGLPLVVILHNTDLVGSIVRKPLPAKLDPLSRARGYREMARLVEEARTKLLADGKPVFIIGGHYGITGLLTFYVPEARTNVTTRPLVFGHAPKRASNQFYFWPGYHGQRSGHNAVFVQEVALPSLVDGWAGKWLSGEPDLWRSEPQARPAPPALLEEFDSVTDTGLYPVRYHGRVCHIIQIFECRNAR
jgi:membrane-associated phospholipid phosphatase